MWRLIAIFSLAVGLFAEPDLAMFPGPIITNPGPEYNASRRKFQGIPGIERAANGRLWALWYAGDTREGPGNYVVLVTSGDDGKTWSAPKLVIDPPGYIRAFDAGLWHDPAGRLWLYWSQAAGHWDGRGGVWTITTGESDRADPKWSAPRRIADGVMMNKPIVLKNGAWLFPVIVGLKEPNVAFINRRDHLGLSDAQVQSLVHDLGDSKGANVLASTDRGATFRMLGKPGLAAGETVSEHMLIERRDRSLWMLARTRDGIGSSVSSNGGHNWSDLEPSGIKHPPTRFFIRRLRSGALMLVKNNPSNGKDRSRLTAFLSDDDGKTWTGGLVLDERNNVSYPDGVETPQGVSYVIYDRERFSDREILMARFTEKDVRAASCVTADCHLRAVVNRATLAAPDFTRDGWRPLLDGKSLAGWHGRDTGKPNLWQATRSVAWGAGDPAKLQPEEQSGEIIVNGTNGRTVDLISDEKFDDYELYVEFLIPAKSNSGVYFAGLYEVQVLDSYGVEKLGVHDCGAIYERWVNGKGEGGTKPLRNASRPSGQWQSFRIRFRAPHFDNQGRKTENARFLEVLHNGVVIHQDVEAEGPTRASLEIPEALAGPIMLQGDHGPVAFRRIYVRRPSLAGW